MLIRTLSCKKVSGFNKSAVNEQHCCQLSFNFSAVDVIFVTFLFKTEGIMAILTQCLELLLAILLSTVVLRCASVSTQKRKAVATKGKKGKPVLCTGMKYIFWEGGQSHIQYA